MTELLELINKEAVGKLSDADVDKLLTIMIGPLREVAAELGDEFPTQRDRLLRAIAILKETGNVPAVHP